MARRRSRQPSSVEVSERTRPGDLVESYHLTLTQELLQMNYSLYRRQQHRKGKAEVPPSKAVRVRWGDPVRFLCSRCRKRLVDAVPFQTAKFAGVVEDSDRWYLRAGGEAPWGA